MLDDKSGWLLKKGTGTSPDTVFGPAPGLGLGASPLIQRIAVRAHGSTVIVSLHDYSRGWSGSTKIPAVQSPVYPERDPVAHCTKEAPPGAW